MTRRQQYYRYLESSHWRELRQQAFIRDGFKCTQCGSGLNLRGHHKRYQKNLEETKLSEVQTLCNSCHEALHREKAINRRLNRRINLVRLMALDADDAESLRV